MNRALMTVTSYPRRVMEWLKRRVKFVTSSDTYLSRLRTAPRVSQSGSISEVADVGPEEMQLLIEGQDFQRVPGPSKIPAIESQAALKRNVAREVGKATWEMRLHQPIREKVLRGTMKNIPELPNFRLSPTQHQNYQRFASRFTGVDAEMVTVGEGKSPAESWDRTRRGYLISLIFFAILAGWELLPRADVCIAHQMENPGQLT